MMGLMNDGLELMVMMMGIEFRSFEGLECDRELFFLVDVLNV